jgi:hypothetical protein
VEGCCECGDETLGSIKWIGGSRTHSPIHQTAHTDACKTYRTAYTAVSLRMNPGGSKHVGDNRN